MSVDVTFEGISSTAKYVNATPAIVLQLEMLISSTDSGRGFSFLGASASQVSRHVNGVINGGKQKTFSKQVSSFGGLNFGRWRIRNETMILR